MFTSGKILSNFFYLSAFSIYSYKNIPPIRHVINLLNEKRTYSCNDSTNVKIHNELRNVYTKKQRVYQGRDLSKSTETQIKIHNVSWGFS